MAFTPKQQASALVIAAAALGLGGATYLMGDNTDDAPKSAPIGETAVEASARDKDNPYAGLAARAQEHGAPGAEINFMEQATPLFNVLAAPQNYSGQDASLAMRRFIEVTRAETFNLAQSTLGQYSPAGNLQRLDEDAASALYKKGQEDCAPFAAEDAGQYYQDYNGKPVRDMVNAFVGDVLTCLNTLDSLNKTNSYTNDSGQAVSVSASFKNAAFPVDQDWAKIIAFHNDYLGAYVGKDAAAETRLKQSINR